MTGNEKFCCITAGITCAIPAIFDDVTPSLCVVLWGIWAAVILKK